jgi:cytochrome c oxidase assembly protein subunit 15
MDERATDRSAVWLRRLALAAVIINVVIVVTGGAVRLTGSGLGCPEWPTCEAGRVLPSASTEVPAWQQKVEFGNRALSVVVGAVALGTLVAARRQRPRRRDVMRSATLLTVGVVAQGVLGGVTVRTGLHPLIVAAHFLASIALIAAALVLYDRVRSPAGPARVIVRTELRHAQRVLLAVVLVVITLGTLVTASGPHPGDPGTPRLGLDPRLISQFHADAVFLLLGLAIALWFALRATDAPAVPRRAATVLLGVVLGQGTIGYVQYFTGLPEVLVGAHMLGACLVWIAALHLWLGSSARSPVSPDPDPAAPAHADSAAA